MHGRGGPRVTGLPLDFRDQGGPAGILRPALCSLPGDRKKDPFLLLDIFSNDLKESARLNELVHLTALEAAATRRQEEGETGGRGAGGRETETMGEREREAGERREGECGERRGGSQGDALAAAERGRSVPEPLAVCGRHGIDLG